MSSSPVGPGFSDALWLGKLQALGAQVSAPRSRDYDLTVPGVARTTARRHHAQATSCTWRHASAASVSTRRRRRRCTSAIC